MKSNDYYIVQEQKTSYVIENVKNTKTEANTETSSANTTNQAPTSSINWNLILIIYVVFFGGWLFFNSRKQKKKEKAVKEMQEAIKIGDDVYTTSGFYGKIADVLDHQYVVEFGTNKGVRIPVKKSEVYPAKTVENKETDKEDKKN